MISRAEIYHHFKLEIKSEFVQMAIRNGGELTFPLDPLQSQMNKRSYRRNRRHIIYKPNDSMAIPNQDVPPGDCPGKVIGSDPVKMPVRTRYGIEIEPPKRFGESY